MNHFGLGLRRSGTDWWIRFFKEIVQEGLCDNTDYLQIKCFKFCLFPLIQKELDDIKDYWNNHPIRDQYSQTGNQDQQVGQMFFILLGTVPVNTYINIYIYIFFLEGGGRGLEKKRKVDK